MSESVAEACVTGPTRDVRQSRSFSTEPELVDQDVFLYFSHLAQLYPQLRKVA